jgi:ribosomal-protein-serine acetyltransferase
MADISKDPLLLELPDRIVGERILLRPLQAGDGAAFWEALQESLEHLRPWQHWMDWHETPLHSEVAARRAYSHWVRRQTLVQGIWEKAGGRFLGTIALEHIDWTTRSFGVGYWLRASAEGHGFMTEAVRLVCRFAFEELGAQRLAIWCDALNGRSAAIPRRLGFVCEGRLRNERHNSRGELQDTLVFSLISNEYEKFRSQFL